jgi:hypothetical protein
MSETSQNGRTIRMFLVDGSANGVITAEIMNWTGHAVVGPRSKLPELLGRDEAARTGIYFLTGPDPESGSPSVYIGEGDDVGKRLRAHAKDGSKDFWEKVCFITSKDHNLTKAHGRYLESRLIEIAKAAGRAALTNSTNPDAVRLPEADVSDMEYFIDQIRLVLPVLGMDFLRPTQAAETQRKSDEVVFELKSRKHSLDALAVERDDEFVVLKGSAAQPTWIGIGSEGTSYGQLHDALLKKEKIALGTDGNASFTDDVPFKSPSAAAAVVLGRPSNGRLEWRVKGTRTTYADWQNEQLDAVKGDSHEAEV